MINYHYNYEFFNFTHGIVRKGEAFTYNRETEICGNGYYANKGSIICMDSSDANNVGIVYSSKYDDGSKIRKQYSVNGTVVTEYEPQDVTKLFNVNADYNTYQAIEDHEFFCIARDSVDDVLDVQFKYIDGQYTLPKDTSFIVLSGSVEAENNNLTFKNCFKRRDFELQINGKESLIGFVKKINI